METSGKRTDSDALEESTAKKRRCADVWIMNLEYQNKYGYRRYSLDSAEVDVNGADGAYVPFKVCPGEHGETEIHIVANERIVSAIEQIEDFAKSQAVVHARSWFGRSISGEEVGAIFKSSIKRDERYPTKIKTRARQSTIIAYTALGGETLSGQGSEFLADLIKTQRGLQGLQASGKLAPAIWSTSKSCGVHFNFSSLNLSARKRESVDTSLLDNLEHILCGSSSST